MKEDERILIKVLENVNTLGEEPVMMKILERG